MEKTGLFCREQKILPVGAVPLQVPMNSMAYRADQVDFYVTYYANGIRFLDVEDNPLEETALARQALFTPPRPHISTRAGALRTEAHRLWAQWRAGPGSLVPASFSVSYCICINCNDASTHSQQGLAPP